MMPSKYTIPSQHENLVHIYSKISPIKLNRMESKWGDTHLFFQAFT